jgi:hypothetical protein
MFSSRTVPGRHLKLMPFPLCRKHVVFGKVVEGLDIVKKVEEVPVDGKDRPLTPVVIKDCGEVKAAVAKADEPAKGTVSILWPLAVLFLQTSKMIEDEDEADQAFWNQDALVGIIGEIPGTNF